MTMMQGLPLTGVSGSINAKKKGEIWSSGCLSHVKYLHKLLASLYDGLESDEVYDDDSDDDIKVETADSSKCCQMFADHCYKLVTLMCNPTNGPVELPVMQIIAALTRCLKLSYADVLSVPSRSDLANLLPLLHQCCMDVLSQLIVCCGRDILHLGHVVVDLCLQTIVSSGKMSSDAKSRTKASAYQAMVLWVRTCGWGKYLTSHRKLLMQEVMADTQADAEDKMAKNMQEEVGKTNKHSELGKKRKGSKKKRRKGDSYMDLDSKEEEGAGKEGTSQGRVDLIGWAFSLNQLTVENLPFSMSQNLISHVITTASTVQRLALHRPEPYTDRDVRKGLYQAVASCLSSPLDFGCNRNDAVSHYQLTNSAVELLSKACHGEDSQIQTVCSQALYILRASGNLKGPVIRKVLDYEDTGVEDVGQLMREKDQMADSIEDLRRKLMNSEMENEQQARLISSMREQMSGLQSQVSSASPQSLVTDKVKMTSSQPEHSLNNEDIDDDSNDDDEEDDVEARDSPALSERHNTSDKTNGKRETDPIVCVDELNDCQPSTSKDMTECDVAPVIESKKRPNPENESPRAEAKKSKMKLDTCGNVGEMTSVENMLQDFIDAPPDA